MIGAMTDDEIQQVLSSLRLSRLEMKQTQISHPAGGMRKLGKIFPLNLRGLDVEYTEVHPENNIKALQNLESLSWVRDEFQRFNAHPDLNTLKTILENNPKLKELRVAGMKHSYSVDVINSMKNLNTLSLEDCNLTDAQLKKIVENNPELAHLSLSENYKLTEEGFVELKKLRRLNTLDVSATAFSSRALYELVAWGGLKQLHRIDMDLSRLEFEFRDPARNQMLSFIQGQINPGLLFYAKEVNPDRLRETEIHLNHKIEEAHRQQFVPKKDLP